MTALQIFPAWVPSDVLVIGFVVLIALVLTMNRGLWWVVNIMAQDEPLFSTIGVVIFLLGWTGWMSSNVGAGSDMMWMVVGGLVALAGVFIWNSEDLDLRGLI